MITDLLHPSDPRWRAMLERTPHDVYHLPEYVELSARHEGGVARGLYAEDDGVALLAPVLIRPLPSWLEAPPHWRDATVPYGYGGPVVSAPENRDAVRRLATAIGDRARAEGVLAAFFRLNPLLALPHDALTPHGHLVSNGAVVYCDLTHRTEQLWSDTRESYRRNIKKLWRKAYEARIDEWSHYSDFVRIYRDTMDRVDADRFYFFSDRYFEDLRESLGEHLHLVSVMGPNGDLAAGGLFYIADGIAQYHLGATDRRVIKDAPSKLMIHAARAWARDAGAARLHLGGGVGAEASNLLHFKRGFSPLTAEAFTYRAVFDETRYATLSDRWRERHLGAADDPEGFFPLYRRTPAGAFSAAAPSA